MSAEHPLESWFKASTRFSRKSDLARAVGISPAHLSCILQRTRGVSLPIALKLNALTGIDVAEFTAEKREAAE